MLNNITLQGRLTADPEIRQTEGGVSVARFQIAVERNYKNKDGSRITDFLPVFAWRQTAEFIGKYFGKGDMILLRGSLQSRSYEKDGQKRTAYEINAEEVDFCGGKKETPVADVGPAEPAAKAEPIQARMDMPSQNTYTDDFPF